MHTINKPIVYSSINSNAYSIMANVRKALERSDQPELAKEFMERISLGRIC